MIGLSLCGGGARGFALMGALKVLERAGFSPGIISGTSAGAVVGALYSTGLNPDEIFSIHSELDLFKVVKLGYPVDGLSTLAGLRNALKPYLDGLRFRDLRNKFCAVAVDLKTGHEVVFSKGSVLDAVCASCAFPGFFAPYKINNRYYIDGGVISPAPVNALKSLGANRIVSLSLEQLTPSLSRNGILNVFARSIDITGKHLMDEQEANADISIRIPTSKYLSISTDKALELFSLGERTASRFIPEIKALIKK